MQTQLKIQEQIAETILKKNLGHIEEEIIKIRRVPQRLFEDTDTWTLTAKDMLDKFEENMDKPNFINYDMLESKENQSSDTINIGEQLLTELE
jgi:hypothetical protein